MDFKVGDLISYFDRTKGRDRFGVIQRIDNNWQLWCYWGDSELEARSPKPDTPLTWLEVKQARLVVEKRVEEVVSLVRGGAYCSPCGGFGGHRLMCPTQRKG